MTAKDPNYTIKGSRDPLGLQVIWQSAGRNIIPHLSTVSSSIMDFQIISLAYAYKKELSISDDRTFNSFFLCFEQLMAYTRFIKDREPGFNGIDKVRRMMNNEPKEVKIGLKEQLLSNQKAYGIWGKYNRPFREMGFLKNEELMRCYIEKIKDFPQLTKRVKYIWKNGGDKTSHVNTKEIKSWIKILDKPSGGLNKILVYLILNDKQDNELLEIFNSNWNVLGTLNGYDLFIRLREFSGNQNFKQFISRIINTEKTISPLNRIFRYLQTKSYWSLEDIKSDELINLWKDVDVDPSGFSPELMNLSSLLQSDNVQLVKGLAKRNEKVTARRNAAPWLSFNNTELSINHYQGAFYNKEYNPSAHADFNYFFNCYSSLYKQLN